VRATVDGTADFAAPSFATTAAVSRGPATVSRRQKSQATLMAVTSVIKL